MYIHVNQILEMKEVMGITGSAGYQSYDAMVSFPLSFPQILPFA
jgi:hypothetical protein